MLVGAGALVVAGAGGAAISFARMGSLDDYARSLSATRVALARHPTLRDVIRYATLAASGHNTQPWRFSGDGGTVTIRPDLTRRTPVVDPDDHHLYASLGCAAENLKIAAAGSIGMAEPRFDAAGDGAVVISFDDRRSRPSPLLDAILKRQSTRSLYDAAPIDAATLRTLAAAAASDGVDTVLVTDRRRIGSIRDLVVAGNSAQLADPAFVAELKSWLRFNPRAALATRDGLFSGASGNTAIPDWIASALFEQVFTADAENAKYAAHIASSSGIAVFVSERVDRDHWVRAGRAAQRFSLQATALGLKTAYINQAVEVPALRPQLAALVGLPGRRPDIVMRFGRAPSMPYSPRRPVEAVLA